MNRKLYHVIPVKDGNWGVILGGAARASKTFVVKVDAVKFGRHLSASQRGELIIHRKDGTIQNANSHVNATNLTNGKK